MRILRRISLVACLLVGLVGCRPIGDHFPENQVYALKVERESGELSIGVEEEIATSLSELFGTPDEPKWPVDLNADGEDGAKGLITQDQLVRAGGAVRSDREGTHFGLYREHCATCHGLAGDGAGPAASFMNPYPRDFRAGVFKFKSTVRGSKPTQADLERTIREGMRGSAMPAFSLLPDEDVAALAAYVTYLSIRGEVERNLLLDAARESGDGSKAIAMELFEEVQQKWLKRTEEIVEVPVTIPENASAERGAKIYKGPIANCIACHGPDGKGLAAIRDYDDWTKEWTTRAGVDPLDRAATKPFRKRGALPPRLVRPRDLTHGVYHGGARPADLYRRITQGIEGTPMPAVLLDSQPSQVALTEKEVWDLVQYVYQLSPPDKD